MIVNCQICEKEFKTYPYNLKRGKGKYCGLDCCKKGISITLTGTTQSEKTKNKRSEKLKNYKWKKSDYDNRRGTNCHLYKDGRSANNDWRSWIKNRRNRLKKITNGSHTFGEWDLLKKQYNYTCPCCKKIEPEIKLTEDHIIPLSKGGSDNIENIQPLCKNCNCKKQVRIIKY